MKHIFIVLTFLLAILITGCHNKADLSVPPPFPSQSPWLKCSKDTIYFQNSVLPIVINRCATAGCHDPAGHAHEVTLGNYSDISRLVTPGNPLGSKLYTVLFAFGQSHMPKGGQMTVNEEGLIYYWIQQGAVDNVCETPCDSSHVTYDSAIVYITGAWCTSCHGGSSPAYSLSLTTYDQVVASVNSNRLMGAIRQQAGFFPMPKGGQLSPCDINIFQKWINLGMPH